MADQPHLMLIEASGFIHRAYHTGGNQFRSDGLPTWAITGFLGLMWRILGAAQHDQPTHGAAVFDAPGQTFRHELYPAYKRNRPARAAELSAQLPFMRHAAETMGLTPVEVTGFEADDVVATLAKRAAQQGYRVTIVSSDKDFYQLIEDDRIELVDTLTHKRVQVAEVAQKFNVKPHQVPDVQALAGDQVDNVPGVPGVGLKTAGGLIRTHGDIDGLYRALDAGKAYFTGNERHQLKRCRERVKLYRELVTLRCDVPLPVSIEDLALKPIMREHIDDILKRLEASHLSESIFGLDPRYERLVSSDDDPLSWHWRAVRLAGRPTGYHDFTPPDPQCGWFKRRLVRGGPWAPAKIWREAERRELQPTGRDILRCEVAGKLRDPQAEWPRLSINPITEEEYRFMTASAEWARAYSPHDPAANPEKPIDWNRVPI